ncbi:MAG TPA: glucose-1-phosphate adenylyltransferase family protein [bacterium]
MKNVLAMVLAGGRVDELSVLTLHRPKSAVPFGGMYRVIDFPLSNLMHSGVENIGILSQYKSYSLINHIGVGFWWDFVGRNRGATMLPPSTGHKASDWYKGTADAVYQNFEFIMSHAPETVMVLSGDHVYKMDYRPMLAYHREKGADLTIAFLPIEVKQSHRFGVAKLDNEDGKVGGRLIDYKEKPAKDGYPWASLTILMFRPAVMYEVLERNARDFTSHEFGRDIIPMMLAKYKIYGYKFTGYWGYARTIDEYWQTNMDLLATNPPIQLEAWQVRSNLDHDGLRDRPPARVGKNAIIEDALVHNGCEVEGAVRHSIIFPGVKVAKGAVVKDSILFFDTVVEADAIVDKVISDVEVKIASAGHIGEGDAAVPNHDHPALLNSGITLIGRSVHLPPNVRLGRNCIVYPNLSERNFKQTVYESGMTIS